MSAQTLNQLSGVATVPAYERSALRRSIVHIGVGGFHRAHLATYIDELAAAGSTAWAITGAGVMPSDAAMAEALSSQDYLYTLVSRSPDITEVWIIGSIVGFVLAYDDPTGFLQLIASPDTQIVSMTVTEGGYPVDDITGEFIPAQCPTGSTFELLARGLDERRTNASMTGAVAPLTVMSCDNIMTNGAVARAATIGAAARLNDDLVEWVNEHVSFPNSMVDRITPVTTPQDIAWLESEMGISDRWPVFAEPFRQWVVEDNFAGDRLPLEQLDVIITSDIEPYELTKLRLLNAGHSCLAYLASLDGHAAVDTAMADPALRRFVETLLHHEAKATLPTAAGIDLDDYIAALIDRFSNPMVGDQIARLCLDGTAKFPKFLVPTIRAQIAGDQHVALSALALAGWCEYLRGDNLSSDPQLDAAVEHAQRSVDEPEAFLDFVEIFGDDLRNSTVFVEAFTSALSLLRTVGVQSAIAAVLQRTAHPNDHHTS